MAENKKSFIGYADWGDTFEMLDDAEAGKLIKHFFKYIQDESPILEDKLLQVAFHPIKLQLKRDLVKWDEIKVKRSDAGKKSSEIKKLNNYVDSTSTHSTSVDFVEPNSTSVDFVKTDSTKSTVTVTVNDTVNVNEINTPTPEKSFLSINGFKAGKEHLLLELPETQKGAAQQYLKITKQKDISIDAITGLWEIFKIKEFTGTKYYSDVGNVYSHFFNGLKFEKLEENKSIVNQVTKQKIYT